MQRGAHVVVATPTASGKSLCYTLPVVAGSMTRRAKALYLFPTKALAQDQVAELLELNKAGNLGLRPVTFDGDTPGAIALDSGRDRTPTMFGRNEPSDGKHRR